MANNFLDGNNSSDSIDEVKRLPNSGSGSIDNGVGGTNSVISLESLDPLQI